MAMSKALISAGFLIQRRRKEPAASPPLGCYVLSCKPETTVVAVEELKKTKPSILKKNDGPNFPTLIHQFSKF